MPEGSSDFTLHWETNHWNKLLESRAFGAELQLERIIEKRIGLAQKRSSSRKLAIA